jgi:DNA-binding transcriptional regulator YiaG
MRELVHTEMTSESPDGNGGSLQITETTIPMQSVADALAIAQEADQEIAELRANLKSTQSKYARLLGYGPEARV